MTTRMTVNGVSVCPTERKDTSILPLPLPVERRSGFANTTTAIWTANCSPAWLPHWTNAAIKEIYG